MGALEDITGAAKVAFRIGITDDSSIHQLNRVYCVACLIIMAMLISAKQYVGSPINCFCPAELVKSQLEYIHSYCWVKNTYAVPFEEGLPKNNNKRKALQIAYYQWVPLIFVFQAFLFYTPRMFWKHFCAYSGINLKKVLRMVNSSMYESPEERSTRLDNVVSFLDKWIEIRDCVASRHRKATDVKKTMAKCGIHFGNVLCLLFVITGVLYLVNSVVQIILLDAILGNDFSNLGIDVIKSMAANKKWEDLHRFPRVTYCDFIIRQLTNSQRWTVQCSLPINLFNEKLFTTLWFVLIAMTIINSMDLLHKLYMFFLPSRKHLYIKKYYSSFEFPYQVRTSPKLPEVERQFVNNYLKSDGVFVLWLISHTSSPVTADELVSKLIKHYIEKPGIKAFLYQSNNDINM